MKNIYNLNSIKHLVINGDGASWVKKVTINQMEKKKIYQKDAYHICMELREKLGPEVGGMLGYLFKNHEYKCLIDTLESLELSYIESEQYEEYKEALQYVSDGLERYEDIIGELPEAPNGTIYKSMGNAESNIYTLFADKLKSKRKSYSKTGALCVAYVTKMKIEGRNVIETLEKEIKIDNEVEEWVNKLEKKARKNKYRKEYDGKTKRYEYPNISSAIETFANLRLNFGVNNIGNYLFS